MGLPGGRWVDVWRALRYRKVDGSFSLRSRRVALKRGGREVKLPPPLDQLPLLARAGTILPLLSADVDTLTDYGRADGLVHLRDRAGRMRLLAFPRGHSEAGMRRREALRSDEGRRGWRLTIRGKRRRRYSLEVTLATLARPFRPCAVSVRGHRLRRSRWSYSRRTRVLRTSFRVRSGRVSVLRRCG